MTVLPSTIFSTTTVWDLGDRLAFDYLFDDNRLDLSDRLAFDYLFDDNRLNDRLRFSATGDRKRNHSGNY